MIFFEHQRSRTTAPIEIEHVFNTTSLFITLCLHAIGYKLRALSELIMKHRIFSNDGLECAIKSHLRCVATLPCEMFQQDSAPAHRARETIKLLQRETPAFISPDLWPPNSPDLIPVNLQDLWSDARSRLPEKSEGRERVESDWLRSGPDCNRT